MSKMRIEVSYEAEIESDVSREDLENAINEAIELHVKRGVKSYYYTLDLEYADVSEVD